MDWSKLDVHTGVPVDCEDTKNYHQFISADDSNLYFNVFYAPLEVPKPLYNNPKKSFAPEEFIEKMCAKTPSTIGDFQEIGRQQGRLMNSIRPYGKKGFQPNELAKTVQFVLPHDKDYKNTGFEIRPVLGLIKDRKTYRQAEEDIFQNEPNYILTECFNYYIANYVNTEQELNKPLRYSKILDDIGFDICKETAKLAYKENIDCICRIDSTDDGIIFDELNDFEENYFTKSVQKLDPTRRYKSVIKQNSRSTKNEYVIQNSVAPITASRKDIDFWNIMTIAETFCSDQSLPLPEGTSLAIANYKRHIVAGKRMGFLSP